ncbi:MULTISPECIES: 3-isopropylmalate dehydrogenase [Micrococcaceae]|uniref:3-isopropylmalate dehydrogenase n=1 Tax=Micrococcaceae TaxID=1268 RepID=UPI00209776F8|nr:3-isopropylmalate dehydrogenase [Arthrobacter sp. H16F315]MDD1475381.1 3-isopropylmalate dehydrogenase [Arthrobacter sp. H16F315]
MNANSKSRRIGVLPGDGIGPEIVEAAVDVLKLVSEQQDLGLEFETGLLGGCAIEEKGTPLPEDTIRICKDSEAVLVGAVGGPKWDQLPDDQNPGPGGLLRLRRDFNLFANLRPGISYLPDQLRVGSEPVDIMLVREAVGGAYFSPRKGREEIDGELTAFDTMEYTATQIRDIVRVAAQLARSRGGRLTSVDKANVLESSRLWREVAIETLQEFPDVEVEHLYVDNCAMQLILRPSTFDVIVTENLFGDILSDEIAGIVGSLGLMPSGSLRHDRWGLYEPVHGSAPGIAGLGIANPTATILSAAMLLRHSLGLAEAAAAIENACIEVMSSGVRTADLAIRDTEPVSTSEFAKAVCQALDRKGSLP